ncbi:radical SAM family Fe-S protein [Streptomyces sp. 769]|nr:radical SAM family Fe-S protein [Streptomyces sp. 769]
MPSRTAVVEELMERFAQIPREAVLKEDLLRGGLAFDESALSGTEDGDVKPKSYFIFSFDHRTLPELGATALKRPPEEIVLTGGPYELRRTVVSVRVNPQSPYRVRAGEDGAPSTRRHSCPASTGSSH